MFIEKFADTGSLRGVVVRHAFERGEAFILERSGRHPATERAINTRLRSPCESCHPVSPRETAQYRLALLIQLQH